MSDLAEQIAEKIVRNWYRGPQNLHHSDDMAIEIADITAALVSYGQEIAKAERARCLQAVKETRYPNAPYDEWRGALLMKDYCVHSIRSLSDPS